MNGPLELVRDAAHDEYLESIAAYRREIPAAFAAQRDVPIPETIVRTATLSTFHGCPPDEIEAIVRHLMTAHDLDVTVKLNPTLLGPAAVAEILHERLGYRDVVLVPVAFRQDLQWDHLQGLLLPRMKRMRTIRR